jgi:hypothetical protein
VVFIVEKDVRVERRSTCDYQNDKKISRQQEICNPSNQKDRNEEERRVITLFAEVCPLDEMIFRIVSVMKIDMVAEEFATHLTVAELVMQQRLPK